MKPQYNQFQSDVYNVVAQIPPGRVLTYGHIARLVGWPSYSRLVGRVMREVPRELALPCHRVVNAQGRTAPTWPQQEQLLRAEGVAFAPSGHVLLDRSLWHPGEDEA